MADTSASSTTRGARKVRSQDLPVKPPWTTQTAAKLVGVSIRHLYRLAHLAGLEEARYGRNGRHPRKVRFYTDDEISRLRALRQRRSWTVVKLKPEMSQPRPASSPK